MAYRVKPPWILRKLLHRQLVWNIPVSEKPAVYLTFDDGPHPTITPFVLEQLNHYNAKATFFCIGKNVVEHHHIYNQVIEQGHTIGNHTYNHLNGWNSSKATYITNTDKAAEVIDSKLFRPPYGRIKRSQVNALTQHGYTIYMWNVLSADFDRTITPQQCLDNVLNNLQPGSIVVFHDSEKAWNRMCYALPLVLEHCKNNNWDIKALP